MKRHHYLAKAGACILSSLIVLNAFTVGRGARLNDYDTTGIYTSAKQTLPVSDSGITESQVNSEEIISDSASDAEQITMADNSYQEVIESDNTTGDSSETITSAHKQTSYSSTDESFSENPETVSEPTGIETSPGVYSYRIPDYEGYEGFKSYESYTALREDCPQGELQKMAVTDESGFRLVENRYLVAIGTHFNASVGTWFDIILENGTRIHCIVGDIKDDRDTDSSNIFTMHSKCCTEFLISMDDLDETVKKMGDCSYYCNAWNSPVEELIIYNQNELNLLYED